MSENIYPDLATLCRLCLDSGTAEISLFHKDASDNVNQLSLPVRIISCAAIEILPNDGLPKSICAKCRFDLEQAYFFRKHCQVADSKLKRHQRLLSLGKKSRVFNRTAEDEEENEIEFQESQDFIDKHAANYIIWQLKKKEHWKYAVLEHFKNELLDPFMETIKDIGKEELRSELEALHKKEIEELKRTLRIQLKKELRRDIEKELRTKLKSEIFQELRPRCLSEAKLELRSEVMQECREAEAEHLLSDLEQYISLKQQQRDEKAKETKTATQIHYTIEQLNDAESLSYDEECKSIQKQINKIQKSSNEANNKPLMRITRVHSRLGTFDAEKEEGSEGFMLLQQQTNVESNSENLPLYETHASEEADDSLIYFDENNEESLDSLNFPSNGNEEIHMYLKSNYDIKNTDCGETNDASPGNSEDTLDYEPDDGSQLETLVTEVEYDSISNTPLVTSRKKVTKIAATARKQAIVYPSPGTNANKELLTIIVRNNELIKSFGCTECPQKFSTETSLKRHLSVHERLQQKGLTYQCPQCLIFLSCNSALKRHMLKHTGNPSFTCHECGKSFLQKEILKRHMLTHSAVVPFSCNKCGRSFKQKSYLKQHMNKHHTKNAQVQQHKCHMCPKSFNHSSGLSRHLAAHSGVNFQCKQCNRIFGDRSSVKRHVLTLHSQNLDNAISVIDGNQEDLEYDVDSMTQQFE